MTFLTIVFFVFALVSALAGKFGVTILSLLMVGFMIFASKVFAKQDAAYRASPEYARNPRATQEILDEAGVECSTPKDQP